MCALVWCSAFNCEVPPLCLATDSKDAETLCFVHPRRWYDSVELWTDNTNKPSPLTVSLRYSPTSTGPKRQTDHPTSASYKKLNPTTSSSGDSNCAKPLVSFRDWPLPFSASSRGTCGLPSSTVLTAPVPVRVLAGGAGAAGSCARLSSPNVVRPTTSLTISPSTAVCRLPRAGGLVGVVAVGPALPSNQSASCGTSPQSHCGRASRS